MTNKEMSGTKLRDVQQAIDKAAAGTGFRCVPISWEDAQRGTVDGSVSCWGGNISDVRLWEKSGQLLYTCRSENWNERLGYVAAKDVAVVTGNELFASPRQLAATTLQKYLLSFGEYASYAGVTSASSLYDDTVDQIFSIRFQTVFLPVEKGKTVDFCTEVYNYNTMSDDDPRNMALLCTAQGTSVQQDGEGAKKLFHHEVDQQGIIHRFYLEAEQSAHKVGGAQVETAADAAAAASRGKSSATFIGTKAMGTRFNVQMLIQLPLKQKPQPPRRMHWSDDESECDDAGCGLFGDADEECEPPSSAAKRQATGVSNAARVSRGTEYDTWGGVAHTAPVRDPSMHGTITVTMYYTVVGGVPTEADVKAAVADLDTLYKSCPSDKRLVDCTEVTAELTVKNLLDIHKKVQLQPYSPPQMIPPDTTAGFPS